MSTFPDRIGRPTARTSLTGDLANASTMSRSWIIRSSTTSTSSERGVNTLSRCTSKNMGCVSSGTVARTAGLKRSRCPTCAIRLCVAASATSSSASASVAASGFSISTSTPAFINSPRHGQVMHRRSRHRRGLQFAVRGQHLRAPIRSPCSRTRGHGVGAVQVRIDHSQQAHRFPLLFEFLVDSGMIASEDAHAHHGDGNRILRWQEKFSMAGCRKANCKRKAGKEHLD